MWCSRLGDGKETLQFGARLYSGNGRRRFHGGVGSASPRWVFLPSLFLGWEIGWVVRAVTSPDWEIQEGDEREEAYSGQTQVLWSPAQWPGPIWGGRSVFYQLCHLSLVIPDLSLAIPGLSLAIPGLSLLVPSQSQDGPGKSYPPCLV